MNGTKKVYEYSPLHGAGAPYLVDSDEYLLAINTYWVAILHKPFNRWLEPVSLPDIPLDCVGQECHALSKPRSFAISFYDCVRNDVCMMFYSLSPSCDRAVLDKCVSMGGTRRRISILPAPDREYIYLASEEFLDIKEISMDDGNSAEIGNFVKWPEYWMLYEHTIYAVHLDNVCELRVCAFDVQCRQWGDERSHRINSSKTSSEIFGLCSHRNVFLVCYQRYIYVLDVVNGGRRYVDIRHLALPEQRRMIIKNRVITIHFQLLNNGELMLLLSGYRLQKNMPADTRLRVVAAFQPQKLSAIACRAVHESMPAETWKALRDFPLGDTVCLVKNLFTIMKSNREEQLQQEAEFEEQLQQEAEFLAISGMKRLRSKSV